MQFKFYPSWTQRKWKSKSEEMHVEFIQVEVGGNAGQSYPSRSQRQCMLKLSKLNSEVMEVKFIQVKVRGNAIQSYPSRSRRKCKWKLSKSKIKKSNRDSHTIPFYTFYLAPYFYLSPLHLDRENLISISNHSQSYPSQRSRSLIETLIPNPFTHFI
jgi:hypothetical protein